MLTSTGKLVYFRNWAILECDTELQKYYQWWVLKNWGVRLQGSKFGPHISVIRGDVEQCDPLAKEILWRQYENQFFEFIFEPNIRQGGDHFWVDAYCPEIEKIRLELGLNPQPKYKLHFTIGRLLPHDVVIFNREQGY
jgi:hypothetical protein